MNTNPQLPDLSNVCFFLECQGFYISDSEQHTRDKEFILRELGYCHWFFTGAKSGSLLYSTGMSYEGLTTEDKLDVKHRVRYVHGLPFEDKFFEDNEITLRDRNKARRDIVKLYANFCTDSRRNIAFKGYQTGQLLKNVSDTIPLIDLDTIDFSRVQFRKLPFTTRCETHLWTLHCCKESCVYYAHSLLANNITTTRENENVEEIRHRLEYLNI